MKFISNCKYWSLWCMILKLKARNTVVPNSSSILNSWTFEKFWKNNVKKFDIEMFLSYNVSLMKTILKTGICLHGWSLKLLNPEIHFFRWVEKRVTFRKQVDHFSYTCLIFVDFFRHCQGVANYLFNYLFKNDWVPYFELFISRSLKSWQFDKIKFMMYNWDVDYMFAGIFDLIKGCY